MPLPLFRSTIPTLTSTVENFRFSLSAFYFLTRFLVTTDYNQTIMGSRDQIFFEYLQTQIRVPGLDLSHARSSSSVSSRAVELDSRCETRTRAIIVAGATEETGEGKKSR